MLSFPPGTKMVHFPGLASRSLLYSEADIPILFRISLEDSEIPGSQPVCGSPRLIAAYHVLHRLPSPRHPPYALSSLTIKLAPPEIYGYQAGCLLWPLESIYPSLSDCQRTSAFAWLRRIKLKSGYAGNKKLSEPFVSSTPGLPAGASAKPKRRLVEVSGFEPLTPCLQSRCSSS